MVKENIRSLIQGTLYCRRTRLITKRVVEVATRNLNMFSKENGVSEEYSPLTIITGSPTLDARVYLIDFGAYIEVFEDKG